MSQGLILSIISEYQIILRYNLKYYRKQTSGLGSLDILVHFYFCDRKGKTLLDAKHPWGKLFLIIQVTFSFYRKGIKSELSEKQKGHFSYSILF